MPPVGFEPKISAGEWLQTYELDRAAIGNGYCGLGDSLIAKIVQFGEYEALLEGQ
jgi:hypothetical protein